MKDFVRFGVILHHIATVAGWVFCLVLFAYPQDAVRTIMPTDMNMNAESFIRMLSQCDDCLILHSETAFQIRPRPLLFMRPSSVSELTILSSTPFMNVLLAGVE